MARHKNQTGPVRNRTTPDIANSPDRLKKDLTSAIKLVEKLDKDIDESFNGIQAIKQRLATILVKDDKDEKDIEIKVEDEDSKDIKVNKDKDDDDSDIASVSNGIIY